MREESLQQVAAADTLVVTKTDLARRGLLEERLARLNPAARVLEASFGDVDPTCSSRRRSIRAEPPSPATVTRTPTTTSARSRVVLDEPLDWTAFGIWLTMLLQARGSEIFRVKGLLDVGATGRCS